MAAHPRIYGQPTAFHRNSPYHTDLAQQHKRSHVSMISPPQDLPIEAFPGQHAVEPSRSEMSTPNHRHDVASSFKAPADARHITPPMSPKTGHGSIGSISSLLNRDQNQLTPPQQHQDLRDPILYQDVTASPTPQRPLFEANEIDRHIATRPPDLFTNTSPPPRHDYEEVVQFRVQFRSAFVKEFNKNPKAWLRRERAELARIQSKSAIRSSPPYLAPLAPARAQDQQPIRTHAQKITKPGKPARKSTTANSITVKQQPRAIRANGNSVPVSRPRQPRKKSNSPEPGRKEPKLQDTNFQELEDFCPPISDLDHQPGRLKVEWRGNAQKITDDDLYRHLLHPDEITAAQILRLETATYLTSKRRLFRARVHCARIGKEFRKTDAQQACHIDVNKASKLWTAYEKVGWFQKKWLPEDLQ